MSPDFGEALNFPVLGVGLNIGDCISSKLLWGDDGSKIKGFLPIVVFGLALNDSGSSAIASIFVARLFTDARLVPFRFRLAASLIGASSL